MNVHLLDQVKQKTADVGMFLHVVLPEKASYLDDAMVGAVAHIKYYLALVLQRSCIVPGIKYLPYSLYCCH